MKNIILVSVLLITSYHLSGCSPLIVAGTVAGAGATVAADRRAPDKLLEDQAIEIQATDFIYSHETFGKKVHIAVTSFNGTVLVVGETLNEESKQIIVNKINRMRGVKKVIDEIKVKKLASSADRTNDTWITSKVKSHIIVRKGLLTRSKVVTSGTTVYLMGIVNNQEAKQILKLAKSVNGVDQVIPLFEARDNSLDQQLTAVARIKPKQQEKVAKPTTLEDEDTFSVQPYVLQPAIRMTSDE